MSVCFDPEEFTDIMNSDPFPPTSSNGDNVNKMNNELPQGQNDLHPGTSGDSLRVPSQTRRKRGLSLRTQLFNKAFNIQQDQEPDTTNQQTPFKIISKHRHHRSKYRILSFRASHQLRRSISTRLVINLPLDIIYHTMNCMEIYSPTWQSQPLN